MTFLKRIWPWVPLEPGLVVPGFDSCSGEWRKMEHGEKKEEVEAK